jgi:hypothetical protein
VKFGVSEIRSTGNAIFETSSRILKRSFENVAQLRFFRTTLTDENLIQEEIKRKLNSGNACYHSVQKIFLPSAV